MPIRDVMSKQAIGVTLPDNMVMKLDEFAGSRMWSRSQAARVLIEKGLKDYAADRRELDARWGSDDSQGRGRDR